MKIFLLSILMLWGMFSFAQTTIPGSNCKAFFKFEVNNKLMFPYAATAINFYDLSEGKVREWYWDFGDGNTSREQNPLFIFRHPESSPDIKINPYRTVSLTILTDDCKSYYSVTINIMDGTLYVQPACKARFLSNLVSADSLSGTATIQFINLSEGDSLSYLWRFDDGKTTMEREPKMTFKLKPAKRLVCLTVTGKNKCTHTFCDSVTLYIPVVPKPGECYAYFGYFVNYEVKTFAPALVLDFYSKAPEEVTTWKWDFGDGITSDEPKPTHIFNLPLGKDTVSSKRGLFRKVTLTIKTASGCVASWSDSVNIYMGTTFPPDTVSHCHAWFKHYMPAGLITIPEIVLYQFTDASDGKVTRRLWQFENGETSTLAQPLLKFSIFKPTQKVCLTIYTADSCKSTWCETIDVSGYKTYTEFINNPSCKYTMRFTSGFPVQMSSCAGYAHAQVYLKDSLVKADNYTWSNGTSGQDVKNLCPTQAYSVKAQTSDGCIVSGTFILNSDGTVTEIPVNWWVTGSGDSQVIRSSLSNKNLTVEWILCDGTIVKSDTIPLNYINCGTKESNLILKDAEGNVVYSENISLSSIATGIHSNQSGLVVRLFPNPVNEILHLQYSGDFLNELYTEIVDISGRRMSVQKFRGVISGQQLDIDVSSLGKGIYLCRIIMDKQGIVIEKFSK